jgi:uncharacterized membrane protein HdeD (DUF308 family)
MPWGYPSRRPEPESPAKIGRSADALRSADGMESSPASRRCSASSGTTDCDPQQPRRRADRREPSFREYLVHGGHENPTAAVDPGTGRAHPAGTELGRRLSVLLGIRGLLAVVFGVLVLVWPGITVLALAYVFAAYALVDGIGMIISGFRSRGGPRWSYVLAGVAGVIAGLAAAFWPGITVLVLVVWAGAWAVVTGVLEIVAAVRREDSGRWLTVLAGVLSIVAGLLILIWPGIGALALATVLGIYALVAGVSLLWAAWQVRRAPVVPLVP